MLTAGEAAKVEREALELAGRRVPDRLKMPPLLPGAEEYLAAFFELSTDRQVGMAVGPIPAASIRDHVRGMGTDEAERFRVVIRAMDDVMREEGRKASPDGKPKAKVVGVLTPGLMRERFGKAGR